MAESRRTYLDHNATSPLRPEAAEAVLRALDLRGNASSVHAEGRAARALIEAARERVARLVGADAKEVVFTSGGTEANNLALSPTLRRTGDPDADVLLVGATEHPSVLEGHRFTEDRVETIPVDPQGRIDLAWLDRRLTQHGGGERALVSVQAANNETGVLQPVAEASGIVHRNDGLLHVDAVQAAGRIPLDLRSLGADAVTLSAHKIGGPKGAGALILRSGLEIGTRLVRGGGQERGFRAGTEDVAALAGFGAAAAAAAGDLGNEAMRLREFRNRAETELVRIAPDAIVFSSQAPRLPGTLAFAIPGLKAETALIAFDLAGIAVSSGSACSSGKVRRSHVLDAMGLDPSVAEGAIRVSFGWNSTIEDVFSFGKACETVLATLYKRRANAA
jgi:cysteine desulfurase